MTDTSWKVAIYTPPAVGLPWLAVLYLPGEGSVTATPFESASEAAEYAQRNVRRQLSPEPTFSLSRSTGDV